ncbi:MAG: LysM domain-containing protein [Pseudolabrys sp.]|nr:LysM domain-containing protein [Pseudolabrys sp.]
MAWKIKQLTEVTTVAVVVVLAGSWLWTNWSTADDEIVTGSIARPQTAAPMVYKLPPIITAAASTPAVQPHLPQMNLATHIIEPRETLKSIAQRFNTRAVDLAAINRIAADASLRPGTTLIVPVYR